MPNFELHSHKQIIKHREVVDDDWSVLKLVEDGTPETVEVPAGKIIVPLKVWLAQREQLLGRAARKELGIWFASDELAHTVKDDLDKFAVVAVDFPKFSDGRGYSIAYNLRKRLGYQGELRAIGDVLRDQLFQMYRCGFNAYATRQDRSIHDALKGLTVFSETYQASVDNELPLFRRHPRGALPEHSDLGAGI
ncbi:oxidoreductase [Massilia phosphatilytica]|nr:oxidoreductase [Massilia phosphatilytica]